MKNCVPSTTTFLQLDLLNYLKAIFVAKYQWHQRITILIFFICISFQIFLTCEIRILEFIYRNWSVCSMHIFLIFDDLALYTHVMIWRIESISFFSDDTHFFGKVNIFEEKSFAIHTQMLSLMALYCYEKKSPSYFYLINKSIGFLTWNCDKRAHLRAGSWYCLNRFWVFTLWKLLRIYHWVHLFASYCY
jgi:hypothetical protein